MKKYFKEEKKDRKRLGGYSLSRVPPCVTWKRKLRGKTGLLKISHLSPTRFE
jgi:hypothetical protein